MRAAPRSIHAVVSLLALVAVSSAAFVQAQEGFVFHVTGDVALTLAGEARAFRVYAVDVPENVADGITDPAVRAVLEAAAGTTEHGATWEVPEPVSIGGIALSTPSRMVVTVAARPTEDHAAGLGELRLRFELDLATLTLSPDAPVAVWYFPEAFATRDFYALTEGALDVSSVERVDDVTLRIVGSVAGLLSFQPTLLGSIAHDPDDTIAVTASFDLRQVVGAGSLADLLPGD